MTFGGTTKQYVGDLDGIAPRTDRWFVIESGSVDEPLSVPATTQ
jgi:hypothetical protein